MRRNAFEMNCVEVRSFWQLTNGSLKYYAKRVN